MIGEYHYDSFGNDEINFLFLNDETEEKLLEIIHLYISYYNDVETGFYLVGTASGYGLIETLFKSKKDI